MTTHPWWQTSIIYQIYPRSFQDRNGDGIGDLPGIIARLDYLASLGVDAIWLSPIYPSPMADFGYDVSDYTAIHPLFGMLADFDHLLDVAHQRGLRVLIDLVPNHTSDEHPWFSESRTNRANSKRDWYIWRDPQSDGAPPNNWLSVFGGPAWTFDERTGQYDLHSFLRQQPDLNYRNPEVLAAMLAVMRFWLDKGVDGLRVDVINRMIKDAHLRDEPHDPNWNGVNLYDSLRHIYTKDQMEVHAIIRAMRAVLNEYTGRMMVGEIYLPLEELVKYYGRDGDECHLPFNFQLIRVDWRADIIRQTVETYERLLPRGAWPNYVLGNHDQPRVATRIGAAQARVANMLLLTLRGTPTTYYGEEIGMENGAIPPEYIQDPPALAQPKIAHLVGRDPERTPMQWDASANAGFTHAGVRTWLPVAADHATRNVAQQERAPGSMLNLYRALTRLRRAEPSLTVGDYESVDAAPPERNSEESHEIFAYTRAAPNADRFLIVLNFGARAHTLDLSHIAPRASIAIASDLTRTGDVELGQLHIRPNEGLLLRLA